MTGKDRSILFLLLGICLSSTEVRAGLWDKISGYFGKQENSKKQNSSLTNSETAKIKLPSGLHFNMTSSEALSTNLCTLKKMDVTFKSTDTFILACQTNTPPPFPYQSKKLTPECIPQLTFVHDKLRQMIFTMGKGVDDFYPLIEGGKNILGPLHQGTNMETLKKFDAGLVDQVLVGWKDGPQSVAIHITKYPDGNGWTEVVIFPADFSYKNEIE